MLTLFQVTFQGTQRTLSLNSVTSSTQSYLQVYLVGTEPVLHRVRVGFTRVVEEKRISKTRKCTLLE